MSADDLMNAMELEYAIRGTICGNSIRPPRDCDYSPQGGIQLPEPATDDIPLWRRIEDPKTGVMLYKRIDYNNAYQADLFQSFQMNDEIHIIPSRDLYDDGF